MDPHSLAIPIGFILLAGVLCLLLIDSHWRWKWKLALILIVPAFGLAVWSALSSYKGWPTTEKAPKKVIVYSVMIREPDPEHGGGGAIFILAKPFEEKKAGSLNPLKYATPGGEPRLYQMPYTRPLHEELDQAKDALQEGRLVVLETEGKNPQGRPEENGGFNPPENRNFKIYVLPPPHQPGKLPQ
jgi:hypothetical protein